MDPKEIMKLIETKQAETETLKLAIADAGADEVKVKDAREALTAHEADIDGLYETLEDLTQKAEKELKRKNILAGAKGLAQPVNAAGKENILAAGSALPAEATDYLKKEVAHIQTFRKFVDTGFREIDGEAAKLITPDVKQFKEGGKSGAKMPRSLFIKMLGTQRAKRIGFTDYEIALSRKADAATMVSDVAALGGDTFQEEFKPTVLNMEEEATHIMDLATIIPSTSGNIKMPKAVQDDDDEYGGFVWYWTDEAGEKKKTNTKFTQEEIPNHEVAGRVHVSERLLDRSEIAFEQYLTTKGKASMHHFLDKTFISGDGNGKPIGMLETAGIRVVDRTTAGTVELLDTTGLKYSQMPQHRKNCLYLMEDGVLQLLEEKVDLENRPLFKASYANGPFDLLNGRPYDSMTYMPTVGLEGDIAFVDPSEYYITMEKDMVIRRLDELGAINNEVIFTFYMVLGGQLVQPRACSVLAGPSSS